MSDRCWTGVCISDTEMQQTCSKPSFRSTYVHVVAGGVGGTLGAVVTCPLEVVKTRMQSSLPTFRPVYCPTASLAGLGTIPVELTHTKSTGILSCLRIIIQTEGVHALFKGLGPNLVGVAPSRAIYFGVYATAKTTLNKSGVIQSESKVVHMSAACCAGLMTSTLTSPVWVIKTRLQLENRTSERQLRKTIHTVYKTDGIKGFYRGLSATYFGVTETCLHFILYEHIKAEVQKYNNNKRSSHEKHITDFFQFMLAAATSKCTASLAAYPHEVIRTRLRQQELDGKRRYHSFFQAFKKIALEEGWRGLYSGLKTHLLRQVPNTAIMFLTYEAIVSFLYQEDLQ